MSGWRVQEGRPARARDRRCLPSARLEASARGAATPEAFYAFTSFTLSDDDLPARPRVGRRAASSSAPTVPVHAGGLRGRHRSSTPRRMARSPDVPRRPEGARPRRTCPDAALRLRRVRHLADAALFASHHRLAGDGRRLRAAEPARRRRIRQGVARCRPAEATSRTSSTTSSRRPST